MLNCIKPVLTLPLTIMNIHRFLKLASIILVILASFFLFAVTSFNPLTDYQAIRASKNMLTKVQAYEKDTPLSTDEMKVYYQFITLSDEEKLLIERYGLPIEKTDNGLKNGRHKNDYTITISQGFDDWVTYRTADDCWYGTQKIIGLKRCATIPQATPINK